MTAPEASDSGLLMDVLFVIDATGSMSGALRAAHDRAASIASDLHREHPTIDFRFGSVCYRDPVDSRRDVHEVCDFTPDIGRLAHFLSGVRATGGGDVPEDWVGALRLSLTGVTWRGGRKTLIWIADAPAHGRRFCGSLNHEEESPKLPPLIVEVAKAQIHVQGLSLQGGANATFTEFKTIYDAAEGPGCTFEQFSVGYQAAAPAKRVDVLGRDVDDANYPKDFPSDEDYDSDDDTRGLPPRRNRPPVIDDTTYVLAEMARDGPDDMGSRISRGAAAVVARALDK
jgi:hypothetical protein